MKQDRRLFLLGNPLHIHRSRKPLRQFRHQTTRHFCRNITGKRKGGAGLGKLSQHLIFFRAHTVIIRHQPQMFPLSLQFPDLFFQPHNTLLCIPDPLFQLFLLLLRRLIEKLGRSCKPMVSQRMLQFLRLFFHADHGKIRSIPGSRQDLYRVQRQGFIFR